MASKYEELKKSAIARLHAEVLDKVTENTMIVKALFYSGETEALCVARQCAEKYIPLTVIRGEHKRDAARIEKWATDKVQDAKRILNQITSAKSRKSVRGFDYRVQQTVLNELYSYGRATIALREGRIEPVKKWLNEDNTHSDDIKTRIVLDVLIAEGELHPSLSDFIGWRPSAPQNDTSANLETDGDPWSN